jgi:glycerophosphoryl diester phosphodiesterase
MAPAVTGSAAPTDTTGATPMQRMTVIAHRGASGYLPEHTLEGAAMAHAMGADYIELDVLSTADDHLVVLHDLWLDAVTDAAECFPDRCRPDGRRYAIDFTLEELQSLRVHERLGTSGQPAFPGRFPAATQIFRIPTLAEILALVRGLNESTGREVGIYIEPKAPAWHRSEGRDIMAAVLTGLAGYGYRSAGDKALLQSFDQDALLYARRELGSELRMTQLIGDNAWGESATDFDDLRNEEGLARCAEYAQGIGPWLPQVVDLDTAGQVKRSDLVARAHASGLFVHAYTLRVDQLPAGVGPFAGVVRALAGIGLDGVFTDHPDRVIDSLAGQAGDPA